jgi:hypothetical protein
MPPDPPDEGRVPDWVEAAAELVDEAKLPDPWTHLREAHVELTPEQRSFLRSLAEQPGVPRLRQLEDDLTRPPGSAGSHARKSQSPADPGDSPGG